MWKLFLSALALRTMIRSMGWMVLLLPIAFLLKTVGAPLLAILAVIGLPLLVVLALIGLPLIVVFGIGAALLGIIGTVLTVGLALLKIVLPIVLVFWAVSALFRWMRRKDKPRADEPLTGDVRGPDPDPAL